MEAPNLFIVGDTFRHRSPEFVRAVASNNGFVCRTGQGTKDSEIWVRPGEGGSYWIIRMDSLGHDTARHFGARPHYHKNWVASGEILDSYLRRYTPDAWVYADHGSVLGQAGGNSGLHPDRKAKLQHIMR